jgi:hypothetical protein
MQQRVHLSNPESTSCHWAFSSTIPSSQASAQLAPSTQVWVKQYLLWEAFPDGLYCHSLSPHPALFFLFSSYHHLSYNAFACLAFIFLFSFSNQNVKYWWLGLNFVHWSVPNICNSIWYKSLQWTLVKRIEWMKEWFFLKKGKRAMQEFLLVIAVFILRLVIIIISNVLAGHWAKHC